MPAAVVAVSASSGWLWSDRKKLASEPVSRLPRRCPGADTNGASPQPDEA